MIRLWTDRAWQVGLLKAVLVGAVLGAGALVARKATTMMHPELLVLLAGFLLAGVIGLTRAQISYGVLAVVVAGAAVRFTLPTGTQSRIPMSLVLAAVVIAWWLLDQLVAERRLRLEPSPTNLPLLGFVGASIASLIWSNVFRDPLIRPWSTWPVVQLGGLAVMVLLPGMFLVAANRLREVRWIAWLTGIILVVGALAIAGYYFRIGSLSFLQVRPLFPTWFICLALSLALLHRRLPLVVRLLLLGLAGAWFYYIFVHGFRWLSSWMPALVAMAGMGLLRSRKLLIVLAIFLAVYVAFNLPVVQARIQQESEGSGVTRLDAWAHNWRVTEKHWFLGVGPAGYAVYYMTYFPDEAMATHSTYLDILSQTGVVGFLFFLWFFGALGLVLWRLWRRVRGREDFVEAFALAAIGGYVGALLGMALGDWIVPFVYTQTIGGFDYAVYTWVLLGAAQGLYHIVARQERIAVS